MSSNHASVSTPAETATTATGIARSARAAPCKSHPTTRRIGKGVRKYMRVHLDELVSDPPKLKHDRKTITVEYVIPQSPKPGDVWKRLFTPGERAQWTHRLANLALLSRSKNSKAQNDEFGAKKAKYFTSRSGTASFALTTQMLATPTWPPEVLKLRQRDLIDRLADT